MIKKLFFGIAAFFLSILICGQKFPGANYLPFVEKQDKQISIAIKTQKNVGTLYFIHYRTEGMKSFQIRKMQVDSSGMARHRISTENLYGKNLEYFIVEKTPNGREVTSLTHTIAHFTQKDSPEIYFQDNAAMTATSPRREAIMHVNGSLSTSTKMSDNSEYPGQNYTANGNLRIFRNISKNDYQIDFDTSFAHIDPRNQETESLINLSSMMIRLKRGEMQLEVGDVSVNETEFTTSYLNRRGLRFEMNGKTLYLNSFYTNSQQKTGFDGYGIPESSAGIFGTTAGINVKQFFKVRGMFMTGKDNLDSKTLYSNENPFRAGEIYSLWGEMNFLKNRFQISGEISSSDYGSGQDSKEMKKESDTAWRAGIKYNHGIFSFTTDYEEIGNNFNSIANLFLQNDREGLNSNIGLNIKSFSCNISYVDKKNYINNPLQDMLHQKRVGTTMNWGIGTHFRIGADLSRDNLDYDSSTNLQTSSSDMTTNNYNASLGYMAGSTAINLNLGKTESVNFTSNLNASLALNLRFGSFLTLNPTFSYQENETLIDQSKSTIFNFYLNSEITFIPQYFTMTISASYMNNDSPYSKSYNWTAGCNLNFFMARIFKDKIRPSLSLKSMFQGAKYGDSKSDSAVIHLQADISF